MSKYLGIRWGNTYIPSPTVPLHGEHLRGTVSDSEGEAVGLSLTAIMEVADSVVVDVRHGEAGDGVVATVCQGL